MKSEFGSKIARTYNPMIESARRGNSRHDLRKGKSRFRRCQAASDRTADTMVSVTDRRGRSSPDTTPEPGRRLQLRRGLPPALSLYDVASRVFVLSLAAGGYFGAHATVPAFSTDVGRPSADTEPSVAFAGSGAESAVVAARHGRSPKAPKDVNPAPGEVYRAYLGSLDDLPIRRDVFVRELKRSHLDPEERLQITQTMPGGLRGTPPLVSYSEKPRIEICLDNQLSTFPLNFATSEREYLRDCPGNEVFFHEFEKYWRERAAKIVGIVNARLSSLGIDLDATDATLYQPVACCRPIRIQVGEGRLEEPDSKIENMSIGGHRGFVIYFEKDEQPFSVSLRNDELEIERVSLKDFQQARNPSGNNWIARHGNRFFSDRTLAELNGQKFSLERIRDSAPARDAVSALSRALLIPQESLLKEHAYGETGMESAIQRAREMLVPCYTRSRDELIEKCAVDILSLFLDVADYIQLAKGTMKVARASKKVVPIEAKAHRAKGGLNRLAKPLPDGRTHDGILKSLKRLPPLGTRERLSELVRKFPKDADAVRPPNAQRELEKLDRLVRGSKLLEDFICKPAERCADAVDSVVAVLGDAGYETRVRGMYWWEDAADVLPENHFVVLARKNNFEYAIDVTAAQYRELGITDAVIDTEAAWAKKFHDAGKGYLIKYKDFPSSIQAKNTFYAGLPVGPDDVVANAEDSIILSKPGWYGKGKKFATLSIYTDPDNGVTERIGNRYFVKSSRGGRAEQAPAPAPRPSLAEEVASFLEKPGNWNGDAGDYAPIAIANALRRMLVIHYPASTGRLPMRIPPMPSRGAVSGSPIEVFYTGNHHEAVVDGRRVLVEPDGDCLFRAVLRSAGRDESARAVQHLRRLAADDIRGHQAEFEPYLTAHG